MTHTYNVTGMTCSGCQAKVESLLSKVTGVSKVSIDLSTGDTTIDMDKHISTPVLKEALKDYPKYHLSEKNIQQPTPAVSLPEEESKFWLHYHHYDVDRVDAGRFCVDEMDESFYGRVFPRFFLF